MKKYIRNIPLIVSLFVAWSSNAAELQKRPSPHPEFLGVSDLMSSKQAPLGLLGLPIGTVGEIEGTIVAGSDFKDKPNLARSFLLSVERVNGVALREPRIMEFRPSFEANLPSAYAELPGSKLQAPEATTADSEAAIKAEAAKYAGSRHRLVVYEAGRFDGVPKTLPADCMPWGGQNFGYYPYLVVLKNRP